MAESNFVDYVKIYCRSGKGGRGSTHMRRAKYVPNGGPDGGDGGRGGHIILRGNRNYWTLLHLRYDRHILAGHGESGSKNRSFGKDGQDKVIEVPCGTVVYNAETGEYICDVTEHGQEVVLLKGGRGGLGNWHFKTASAIAAFMARGLALREAVQEAKKYITEAILSGADIEIGNGFGPVNHLFNPLPMQVYEER